ncbi:unnamed protein product [Discosporangium mesarthrocarpum]
MNVSDTEVVRSILLGAGYREAPGLEDASVVLANTCAIREKAEGKVWDRLQYFSSVRRRRREAARAALRAGRATAAADAAVSVGDLKVGVLGCMAERLKEDLLEKGGVDIVTGPDAYRDLPRLLRMVGAGGGVEQGRGHGAVNVQLSQDETYADIAPVRTVKNSSQAVSSFVSIMRGCNNM